jgi:hypothetical protein
MGILLFGATGAHSGEAPAKEKAVITIRPQLNLSQSRNLEIKKGYAKVDQNLSLYLNLSSMEKRQLITSEKIESNQAITFTEIVDNTGHSLLGENTYSSFSPQSSSRSVSGPQRLGQASIYYLQAPAATATSITSLKGVLHLTEVLGEKTQTLKPMSDHLKKSIPVPGGTFTLTRLAGKVVYYTLEGEVSQRRRSIKIRVLDAKGKVLSYRGGGSSGSPNKMTVNYHVSGKVDPAGAIILTYPEKTVPLDLPIALTEIPLTPEAAAKVAGTPQPQAAASSTNYMVKPQQLTYSRSQEVNFFQPGRSQQKNHLNLYLNVTAKEKRLINTSLDGMSRDDIYQLTTVLDDTGKSLLIPGTSLYFSTSSSSGTQNVRIGSLRISGLGMPTPGAKKISKLEGTMLAEEGKGEKRVTVSPLAKKFNTAIDLGANRTLTFLGIKDKTLTWTANFNAYYGQRMFKLTFVDKDGEALRYRSSGSRGAHADGGNIYYVTLRNPLPEGAGARIVTPKTIRRIIIPFALTDLPLTSTTKKDEPPKAVPGKGYSVRAEEFTISDQFTIHFNDHGPNVNESQSCRLQLKLFSETAKKLRTPRGVNGKTCRFTAFEDSTGKNLLTQNSSLSFSVGNYGSGQVGSFSSYNLLLPDAKATHLKRVEGWALTEEVLSLGEKPITSLASHVNKPIKLTAKETFTITKVKGAKLEYTSNFSAYPGNNHFDMHLLKPDGTPLERDRTDNNYRDNVQYYSITYKEPITPEVKLTLTFPDKVQLVSIPFALKDLSLKGSTPAVDNGKPEGEIDPAYTAQMEKLAIQQSLSVRPQSNGRYRVQKDESLEAWMHLYTTSDKKILTLEGRRDNTIYVVEKAIDSTGKNLIARNIDGDFYANESRDGTRRTFGRMELEALHLPDPKATHLKRLQGYLLFSEITKMESKTLDKIKEAFNKPITLDGTRQITPIAIKKNGLLYRANFNAYPNRGGFTIKAFDGETQLSNRGYSSSNRVYTIRFSKDLTETTRFVIEWPGKRRTIRIPFDFRDLPLALKTEEEVRAEKEKQKQAIFATILAGDAPGLKKAIAAGLKVNIPDAKKGIFPIHVAAKKGSVELIKILVEAGADINRYSRDEKRPLGIAKRAGHEELVKYLTEIKAKDDHYDPDDEMF